MKNRLAPTPAIIGFLLPNILGFAIFSLFPVVLAFVMAFTNWSLKDGVPLEFVGLRNFQDLLGMNPRETGAPLVYFFYACGALALVTGVILHLWGALTKWNGTRLSGLLVLGAGGVVLAVVLARASTGVHHAWTIVGLLGLLAGFASLRCENGIWVGRGAIPGVLIAAGGLVLSGLHGPMWRAYEPLDARFWQYLYNTVYLMLGIPVTIAGSLALALLLNERLPLPRARGRLAGAGLCALLGIVFAAVLGGGGHANLALLGLILWLIAGLGFAFNIVSFRTLYYLPQFTAGIAIMILWKNLYNPQTGLINVLLSALLQADIQSMPNWLSSTVWSKPALMLMGFWIGIGGTNMLLYLAALSNVPQDTMEAAHVDGASAWQRVRHVVIPQLAPTTFLIAIMSVIGGIQGGFEQARVMTQGGPDGATTTLSYYVYNVAFQDLDLGNGAAISWIMFAIIFVVTAINWRFGKDIDAN